MENRAKTNDQLFGDYFNLITNTHTPKSLYEAKRLLNQFRAFLGQFPPTTELAIQFLNQFKDCKVNTKARYCFVLSAFFSWFTGEKLPIKIKQAKVLPQYVPGEDIDLLIKKIKEKHNHKDSIERDVLLIETAKMTGLRRGELANLKVGDIMLNSKDPVLLVRGGKGNKDRAVSLNPYIRNKLASFIKGKPRQESVFGLAPKTISMKISEWARKAGVPHIHTHSFRHYVGTTLFEKGANPRAIQAALGHESLDVTMRYAAVTGRDIKQAMELLDDNDKPTENYESTRVVTRRTSNKNSPSWIQELDKMAKSGKKYYILGLDGKIRSED